MISTGFQMKFRYLTKLILSITYKIMLAMLFFIILGFEAQIWFVLPISGEKRQFFFYILPYKIFQEGHHADGHISNGKMIDIRITRNVEALSLFSQQFDQTDWFNLKTFTKSMSTKTYVSLEIMSKAPSSDWSLKKLQVF